MVLPAEADGVDKGLCGGDGQGVGPYYALILTQLQQPQDRPAHGDAPLLPFHVGDQVQVEGKV